MSTEHKGDDLALVADLSRAAAIAAGNIIQPKFQDAAPFVILRDADGKERVELVVARITAPPRKSGHVKMSDAESFIAYTTRFGVIGALIYATPKPARFVAVLNEHGPNDDGANFRDHRATFDLAFSDEWAIWTSKNGSNNAFQSTEAFAEFLEINAIDVVEPSPADFIELAKNFHVHQEVTYTKVIRLTDGQVQLTANQNVEGGGVGRAETIRVPTTFKIEVPVFKGRGAKKYQVEAHFRYRLRGNALSIWYELIRPSKVVDAAFYDTWDQIADQTSMAVLHGSPE